MKVAFLHPDLGIGGAERLIVDAAVAVQQSSHKVHVFTSHHEKNRCFQETCDGTLKVTVYGDWLPRHTFGMLHAFWAYVRQIYLALAVLFFEESFDVFIVDQILFYCHFPDKLLSTGQRRFKNLYRAPLDWFEEYTTGCSHRIVVNSKFTAQIFASSFRRLAARGIAPEVIYPALNLLAYDTKPPGNPSLSFPDQVTVILSINRFEEKKRLDIAVDSFAVLRRLVPVDEFKNLRLVLAGGYDPRLPENVRVLDNLRALSTKLNILDQVVFVPSFSEADRFFLLQRSACVLYTPDREHFGIVPLEAMYASKPVVAVASGGPLESIVHKETGHLVAQKPEAFADAVVEILRNPDRSRGMGSAGRKRVQSLFSFEAFKASWNSHILHVCSRT